MNIDIPGNYKTYSISVDSVTWDRSSPERHVRSSNGEPPTYRVIVRGSYKPLHFLLIWNVFTLERTHLLLDELYDGLDQVRAMSDTFARLVALGYEFGIDPL